MSQNKLTSLHRPLLDGYYTGLNKTSTFCAYVYVCLNGIKFILILSSPIGQDAVFGIYQNTDRIKSSFQV